MSAFFGIRWLAGRHRHKSTVKRIRGRVGPLGDETKEVGPRDIMILLVTYDLKGRPEGYEKLFEALKNQGTWWHYLKSTWLVSTEKTPEELLEELRPHLNLIDKGGDLILITAISGKRTGWLPKKAWDWKAWDWIRKREVDKKAGGERQDKQVS